MSRWAMMLKKLIGVNNRDLETLAVDPQTIRFRLDSQDSRLGDRDRRERHRRPLRCRAPGCRWRRRHLVRLRGLGRPRPSRRRARARRRSARVPAVKFCGLRRAEDAAEAVRLGASYVGVIFASGPRLVTVEEARAVLAATRESDHVRRVGVFGADTPAAIARVVAEVGLDVVQLSADPDAEMVDAVRAATGVEVWAAVRCTSEFPPSASALFSHADAVLVDAKVDGKLGGTGRTLAGPLRRGCAPRVRRGTRLVLAGGLTSANVAQAMAVLQLNVVDVSSGVETAPGIKDHERMRAFLEATHS